MTVEAARPVFDRQDQWNSMARTMLSGEQLVAVFDCVGVGTGFVAVTNRRIILRDNSFLGKSSAVTSIPYRQVQSVSHVVDAGLRTSSTIAITAGGVVRTAEFRGADKAAFIHDTILWNSMAA